MKFKLHVWSFLLIFTLGWTLGGVAFGALDRASHNDALRTVNNRNAFYRVIAGESTPTSPTVDARLALDLREALGGIDPDATQLPDEILKFQGTSNAYGGITDAIGFDPFNGAGLSCSECGPLDREVQQQLLEIKQGHVADVLIATPPQPGYHLIPLDLAWWLWGLVCMVVVVLVHLWYMYFDNREHDKLCAEYPEEMEFISKVDRQLAKVSLRHGDDPEVVALQRRRDLLMAEMKLTDTSKTHLKNLVNEAEDGLQYVEDSLLARKDARRELDL